MSEVLGLQQQSHIFKFWEARITATAYIIFEISWIPLTNNLKGSFPCLTLFFFFLKKTKYNVSLTLFSNTVSRYLSVLPPLTSALAPYLPSYHLPPFPTSLFIAPVSDYFLSSAPALPLPSMVLFHFPDFFNYSGSYNIVYYRIYILYIDQLGSMIYK